MGFIFSKPIPEKISPQDLNKEILTLLANLNKNSSNSAVTNPSLIHANIYTNQVTNLGNIIEKLNIRHQNKIQRIERECAKNIQILETQFTNVTTILQQELTDAENELAKTKLNSRYDKDTAFISRKNTSDMSFYKDPDKEGVNVLRSKLKKSRSDHDLQIHDYEAKMFKAEHSVEILKQENSILKKDCEVNRENHTHALKLLAKTIQRFDTDKKKKQNQNYDSNELINIGLQKLEIRLEQAMQQQEKLLNSHQLKLKTIESEFKKKMEKTKIGFKEEKQKLLKQNESEDMKHTEEINKLEQKNGKT